jgi:ADP-ribose pyrophosphatase YjhB (NUDIX family)
LPFAPTFFASTWTPKARFNIRRYPEHPIPGVGALIFDKFHRILLVERGKEPLKGYWSLPGGVLEPGELLGQAIRREVLEETGLTVELLEVVEIFERIMRDAEGRVEYHYVLVDYLCQVTSGTLQAADDASRAAWFHVDELPTLRLTEGTLPVIQKAFARHYKQCSPPVPTP